MEVATDTLEFSDLKLKFDKESKQISVDVFAKENKSFIHVPHICFRRICDSDEKFEKNSVQY